MQRKKVFLDDCLIGHAATWGEVHALTKAHGIAFIGGARGAEGPSAFYLTACAVERPEFARQRPGVG
jgi:hypothetical protein